MEFVKSYEMRESPDGPILVQLAFEDQINRLPTVN
jgi:hypothetical protein